MRIFILYIIGIAIFLLIGYFIGVAVAMRDAQNNILTINKCDYEIIKLYHEVCQITRKYTNESILTAFSRVSIEYRQKLLKQISQPFLDVEPSIPPNQREFFLESFQVILDSMNTIEPQSLKGYTDLLKSLEKINDEDKEFYTTKIEPSFTRYLNHDSD